jgi:hypothetical protein
MFGVVFRVRDAQFAQSTASISIAQLKSRANAVMC